MKTQIEATLTHLKYAQSLITLCSKHNIYIDIMNIYIFVIYIPHLQAEK